MNHENLPPTTIIIFGATGDLTKRKLVPSLFNLFKKKRLPKQFHIIGFARRPYTSESFREYLKSEITSTLNISLENEEWQQFVPSISYIKGDLTVDADIFHLENFLQKHGLENETRIYYLATSPNLYTTIITSLGKHGFANQENGRRSIVVEKPFGTDQDSAEALNRTLHAAFDESQIFRIDHYLGKETAQNILFFRFANTIFEPIWNRRYIRNIQITVAESVGVEHRAAYYDQAGVLRDMFQNHLLQLLTLTAMEPPSSFDANMLRNEKAKVLRAIRPIHLDETVLGQYEGYCSHQGVKENSRTPSFAAVKIHIDNWRWKGTPFYLRSGKSLKKKNSEIVVVFEEPPHLMFSIIEDEIQSNTLSICIQPDEGIHLKIEVKKPDTIQETKSVIMDFHFKNAFGPGTLPNAYERLLLDAVNNDPSLFARSDEIELAWHVIDPVIWEWRLTKQRNPVSYNKGTWGPPEADSLLNQQNHTWRSGCGEHNKYET